LGDLSRNHRDGAGGGWSDVAEPRKWSSGRNCGVQGKGHRFHFGEFMYEFHRSCDEAPGLLVPRDGKVGEKCGGVLVPRSGTDNIFERYNWLLYEYIHRDFAIFEAAEIAGVPGEEADCLPKAHKVALESMLMGVVPLRFYILLSEETEGIQILGGEESSMRIGKGVLTLLRRDNCVFKWGCSV
jgi:hypothetical protein